MLDPLTTLGLVSNIVQLVDFGLDVLDRGRELAQTGTTTERQHLRRLVEDTQAVCAELQQKMPPKSDQKDEDLQRSALRDPQNEPVFTTVAAVETLQRVPDHRGSSRAAKPEKRGRKPARVARRKGSTVAVHTVPSLPVFEAENLVDLTQVGANEAKDSATSHGAELDALDALKSLGDETQGVATRLSEMLSRLDLTHGTPEDRKRKRGTGHVAQSLLRGLWTSKDVSKTRKELVDLQQQMMFRSSLMQTTSCSALLHSLKDFTQDVERQRADRLAAIDTILPTIHGSIARTMLASPKAATFAADMKKMAGDLCIVEACRRVLKTLMFEKIHSREEAIPEAHASTFSWIFDDNTTTFKHWISSSNGVFWITGKPGSGKSTLMKYVVQHRETTELLRAWADQEELVVAHHYFWNAGTSMQKSQLGLLRTLLFHIIKQCPDLAYKLLPARMKTDHLGEVVLWTREELCETIRLFGQRKKSGTRLCFFIDGLDEYVGEHSDIVELISNLAESPCVKVCVSSRPWNVFTRAYHGRTDGQLEVQDLTLYDIKAFISDSMNADQRFRELYAHDELSCLKLIDSITSKAQGVFLWVYLVVRSLLRGFTNNDNLKILHRRLDTYPDTLDGYFQRMFDRIESVYRVESSRLLLTAISAERTMCFWSPRCIEREMEDPDYALAVLVPPSPHDAEAVYGCDCAFRHADLTVSAGLRHATSRSNHVQDSDEIVHSCYWQTGEDKGFRSRNRQSLTTYLDARCADLLEIVADGISFVHRTARDWLAHGDLSVRLHTQAGPDFDLGLTLVRLSIIDAKRQSRPGILSKRETLVEELTQARELIRGSNLAKYAELLADLERREELWVNFYNM